jgi:hypothetical protein
VILYRREDPIARAARKCDRFAAGWNPGFKFLGI